MGRPAKGPRPVAISDELAARYTNSDQAQRFDNAVRKVFAVSAKRAVAIRRAAELNPTPRGRQPKGKIAASRVSVSAPLF
jgi:hypothetical protein